MSAEPKDRFSTWTGVCVCTHSHSQHGKRGDGCDVVGCSCYNYHDAGFKDERAAAVAPPSAPPDKPDFGEAAQQATIRGAIKLLEGLAAPPETTAPTATLCPDCGHPMAKHEWMDVCGFFACTDCFGVPEICHRSPVASSATPTPEPTRYDQVPDGCWMACIAGLTDIPHEELAALVPRHEGKFDGSMGTECRNAVNALLRSRGWRLEGIGPDVPRGFGIGSGTSPRGLFHAVIVHDGALWHDPHPSRAGVVSLESYEVIVPIHPVASAVESYEKWRAALFAEQAR